MPTVHSKIYTSVDVFHSADALPTGIWSALKSDPRNSNLIYSHALKARQAAEHALDDGQIWLVCRTGDDVEFILSCTHHAMGTYPIFIFSVFPYSCLSTSFLEPRIRLLAATLCECVKVERVYSVFALDLVSRMFAVIWSQLTEVSYYSEPYYAAKISFCTRRTLRHRQFTTHPDISYEMRLAVAADIPATAALCYGFASEAEPFILTMEEAMKEATLLTGNKQLWVHTIDILNKPSEIASIVAVTRESASVAAITKVYTNLAWRSRRWAERLVRKVTQSLLRTKESVILYVAHNNPAASKVYDRVGFAGLGESSLPVDGVDSWLELGFDRDMIELGHW